MQEELVDIYNQLKSILKKYENPLLPKLDLDSRYDLWSFKDVVIDGRKQKEVFFASVIIQSSYVGFYYMPLYTDTSLKEVFSPVLLTMLKGKSCFHIKKIDENLKNEIKNALDIGYELYKKRGWI